MKEPWREGSITLEIVNGRARVIVDRHPSIGGRFCVIDTHHGGTTSYTVWPSGIDERMDQAHQREADT